MLGMFKEEYYALNVWQAIYVKLTFTQSARLELFKKMIPFIEDGVDLHQLIGLLGREYATLSSIDSRSLVLKEWYESMENANNFSSTLAPWVSNTDSMMISTGEEGGKLVNALKNVIKANEDTKRIKATIKSALGYPAFLLVVLMGIMTLSSVKIIPTLEEIMPYDSWPAGAQGFYDFTNFFTGNWPVMLGGFIGLIYGIKFSFDNWTNPLRKYVDQVPPWSSYRSIASAMFLISLSALMATGMPAYDAVKSLSDYSSSYVKQQLGKTISLMDNGRGLGDSLDTNFMNKETGMDIRIYSQASDATKSMDRVGRNAIENTIKSVSSAASLVRMLIMAAVAGYMIWMMVSFQSVSAALKAAIPM